MSSSVNTIFFAFFLNFPNFLKIQTSEMSSVNAFEEFTRKPSAVFSNMYHLKLDNGTAKFRLYDSFYKIGHTLNLHNSPLLSLSAVYFLQALAVLRD
jgi:hypothetical protein